MEGYEDENVKEVAGLENTTTADMEIGAGDDTKDNDKEVP